jgi:aspartyl/asparaginyl beta-hydroxylase (cupin superfamily)
MVTPKITRMNTESLEIFFRSPTYNGKLPYFYNQKDFPQLDVVKRNWKIIWEEVENYEKSNGLISGINTFTPPELTGENPWNNIYLENFMWRFHSNRSHFPKTCELLACIPNCTLAAISILSPNSKIEPHYGDTNAVIRCHLGLKIPAAAPECAIKVGNEVEGWRDGEITMFSEAHLHNTWNNTNQRRYLLVFDIIHEHLLKKKKWICSKVLGVQSFVFFESRISFIRKTPIFISKIIILLFSIFWFIFLPIQRKLKIDFKVF